MASLYFSISLNFLWHVWNKSFHFAISTLSLFISACRETDSCFGSSFKFTDSFFEPLLTFSFSCLDLATLISLSSIILAIFLVSFSIVASKSLFSDFCSKSWISIFNFFSLIFSFHLPYPRFLPGLFQNLLFQSSL